MPREKKKRFALPKRFSAAMSEKAYARMRAISAETGLSNNYILTVVFENLDHIAKPGTVEKTLAAFVAEYGAPEKTADGKAAS